MVANGPTAFATSLDLSAIRERFTCEVVPVCKGLGCCGEDLEEGIEMFGLIVVMSCSSVHSL